jgi:hypothetical protein
MGIVTPMTESLTKIKPTDPLRKLRLAKQTARRNQELIRFLSVDPVLSIGNSSDKALVSR